MEKQVQLHTEDTPGVLPSSSEQILALSTKGATFLMFGQLFTKLVSFALNSVLIRHLSPRIFGITSFLEFILGTTLFFSREAMRLSILRISSTHNNDGDDGNGVGDDRNKWENRDADRTVLQTAVNFSHVAMYIGIPLSLILTTWQYRNINEYFVQLPHFTMSICIIWAACILELMCEPFLVVTQIAMDYAKRSKLESIAVTMGCVTNFLIVIYCENHNVLLDADDEVTRESIAILAFSLGKLVHSLTLLAGYLVDFWANWKPKQLFRFRLTRIKSTNVKDSYYFDPKIMEHFKKVYFQLCFKHLLTEGDKLIINSMCTIEEQGIYSLLSNYGSLITRLLFHPIEESLRLFLARLLSTVAPQGTTTHLKASPHLKLSMVVLTNLTKFYLYLSLMIVVFGPLNSSFVLQFLIGSKWSTTSVLDTIRVYCFYLPFLALNGIFEAFFQSVASGDQILRHSYFMMTFSSVFLLSCWFLISQLHWSINGLIISNIVNMSLRITYCSIFIAKFYNKLHSSTNTTARDLITFNFSNLLVISALAATISILNYSLIGNVKNFQQFFTNVLFAIVLLSAILLKERATIRQFWNKRKLEDIKNV
ncbi:glycolipid translocation protein KNAG_0G01470 [Huiozyma naganishii CBS 8797]|uniref:Man(5)GlcNAc(2)-PP-dolichol translocation protein RFT1 n=1 Tax=Huiozyma naganishii (strain ATCC MYA-139 / BCRC 22969 / CBS 8797 / KCTC 17520 / NBRC 10181 / NCYC 3082 / Yp74L-3) TaxID=1071383 RepID=J7R8K9_HUIN7|nr:hypothetical protein KNAG_0G01470 [Kazachstania naganishii CBS 8797]CCK71205.1 hypothetical protein KNAG_0G01470 [Kazachstania naganishii CBS 8797]